MKVTLRMQVRHASGHVQGKRDFGGPLKRSVLIHNQLLQAASIDKLNKMKEKRDKKEIDQHTVLSTYLDQGMKLTLMDTRSFIPISIRWKKKKNRV